MDGPSNVKAQARNRRLQSQKLKQKHQKKKPPKSTTTTNSAKVISKPQRQQQNVVVAQQRWVPDAENFGHNSLGRETEASLISFSAALELSEQLNEEFAASKSSRFESQETSTFEISSKDFILSINQAPLLERLDLCSEEVSFLEELSDEVVVSKPPPTQKPKAVPTESIGTFFNSKKMKSNPLLLPSEATSSSNPLIAFDESDLKEMLGLSVSKKPQDQLQSHGTQEDEDESPNQHQETITQQLPSEQQHSPSPDPETQKKPNDSEKQENLDDWLDSLLG